MDTLYMVKKYRRSKYDTDAALMHTLYMVKKYRRSKYDIDSALTSPSEFGRSP